MKRTTQKQDPRGTGAAGPVSRRGTNARRASRAFSLIELVIVVVIIAIIGAIAIPKMSRGATGAAESALIQDLSVLRSAIDLYQTEHTGTLPTSANVFQQLTQYSDAAGATIPAPRPSSDTTHIYGPYLKTIPGMPCGTQVKGGQVIGSGAAGAATAPPVPSGGYPAGTNTSVGWTYDSSSGLIQANSTETDSRGNAYSTY